MFFVPILLFVQLLPFYLSIFICLSFVDLFSVFLFLLFLFISSFFLVLSVCLLLSVIKLYCIIDCCATVQLRLVYIYTVCVTCKDNVYRYVRCYCLID